MEHVIEKAKNRVTFRPFPALFHRLLVLPCSLRLQSPLLLLLLHHLLNVELLSLRLGFEGEAGVQGVTGRKDVRFNWVEDALGAAAQAGAASVAHLEEQFGADAASVALPFAK